MGGASGRRVSDEFHLLIHNATLWHGGIYKFLKDREKKRETTEYKKWR